MGKYDRFERVIFHEEDKRPLAWWQKIGIGLFVLLGLYVWLTPNAKAEAPNISRQAPNISHIHCAHIHRHVCGMDGCRMVDIKHLCWRAV